MVLTGAVLGPRLVMAIGLPSGKWVVAIAIAATVAQCGNGIARLLTMSRSPVHELRASARLVTGPLRGVLIAQLTCTALALAMIPVHPIAAFVAALASETLGRYLFFAGVVPKSMASSFLTPKEVAA